MSMSLLLAGLMLAGCSTSGLLNRGRGPQANNVPAGNNLTMPPDLQLPAPGSGTQVAAYQPSAPAVTAPDAGVYGTPAAVPRRGIGTTQCSNGTTAADIYACYGISKLKPDGTKKTTAELSLELRAAILAEKRQQNPSYGTFKNFGQLFN